MATQMLIDGSEEHAHDEALDQWFTPTPIAHRMAMEGLRWAPDAMRILEPSSGAGAILNELRAAFPAAYITHYELDESLAAATGARHESFIDAFGVPTFDLCVMNPPYSNGRDGAFLVRACRHSTVTIALIRTHALHGVERYESVWSKTGVRRVNFFIRRPRFDGPVDGSPQHEFCVVVIGPQSIPAGIEWW